MSTDYTPVATTVSFHLGVPIESQPGLYAVAGPRVEHELEALAMLEQCDDPRAVVVRDEVRRSIRGRS